MTQQQQQKQQTQQKQPQRPRHPRQAQDVVGKAQAPGLAALGGALHADDTTPSRGPIAVAAT